MKKEVLSRAVDKRNSLYLNTIAESNERMWLDPNRKEHILIKSDADIKEKDKKWKKVDNLDCSKRVNLKREV